MTTSSFIQYAESESKRMTADNLCLYYAAGNNGKVSPAVSAGLCAAGFGIPEGFQVKRGGGTWVT